MAVGKGKNVLRVKHSTDVVFDYQPKEFPLVVTTAAHEFLESPRHQSTDFQISELAAEQAGIAKLRKEALNEKIEEEALQKLKDVQEKAYKEAYDLGLVEGREQALEERRALLTEKLGHLESVLKTFEDLKSRLVADHESHILTMIYHLASRIAMREIESSPESILPVVHQVINDTQSEENVVIRLSTEDFQFLEQLKEKVSKSTEVLRRVRLEASDAVQSGGCSLETNYGSIDASVERRTQRAWEVIVEKLPKKEQRTSSGGSNDGT